MEENQTQIEQQVQPKKRGRKPKSAKVEEVISIEEKAPKKRGRKPREKNSESTEELVQVAEQKNVDVLEKSDTKKAKRQPRKPRTDGPQWRDAPEVQESNQTEENQQQDEILFVASESDDFAYATQPEEEKPQSDNEDFDDDIPTSYSTTDEDLIQDNYQNSWIADDDEDETSFQEDVANVGEQDENAPADLNAISDKQNNQRNQQNRNQQSGQQNNRNKWRNKDNRFNNKNNQQNRNQQGGQQNNRFNNKNNNQNRNQQGGQRNQQNNQQNKKQNQPNNQNQKNKQNKPKWLQQNIQEDIINPSDLFDWHVLKTTDNIEKYLAEIYFGKQQPEVLPETQQQITDDAGETLAETQQTQSENLQPTEVEVDSATEVEVEPESTKETETKQLSYWDMLEQSNKEMFDKSVASVETKSEDLQPVQQQQSTNAENSSEETQQQSAEDFKETFTFTIADCGEILSLDNFNELYEKPLKEIENELVEMGMQKRFGLNKNALLQEYYNLALAQKKLVKVEGVLDVFEDGYGGAIVFKSDNYRLRKFSVYVPKLFIEKYSLARGHKLTVLAMPPKREGGCPFAVKITSVMDGSPNLIKNVVAFNDLVPYYPTERIIMESTIHNAKTNVSMRAVDLLAPIGLGQRALIVAPPRTGKTVLMQTMAKSIRDNKPNAHLIVLLVDERPEEVTDFKRSVDADVVASTFDEEASNHVHAAEMVISYARRMVEMGKDVIILLDSITRLARAYNALMPNGGRTMSGGVEANALQKPKKFFGSARNIEGGGSLTIIGTALVETGSKMDEVIFEEFKGTGNLELHLDRALSDKRIFPAINMEKTGTRKEELLYHPDELEKIYTLRRAMHGVPITESMEMLVQRLKKTKTNVEFLLGLNR